MLQLAFLHARNAHSACVLNATKDGLKAALMYRLVI